MQIHVLGQPSICLEFTRSPIPLPRDCKQNNTEMCGELNQLLKEVYPMLELGEKIICAVSLGLLQNVSQAKCVGKLETSRLR